MPATQLFDDASGVDMNKSELPLAVQQRCQGSWSVQGAGLFKWSVFRVYEAALFVQQPLTPESIATEFESLAPFALDLHYLRNVSAVQIAQTSASEMIRLFDIDPVRATELGEQLAGVLPDVGLGDRLVGLFEPNRAVTFFSNEQYLGGVIESAFVPAFAAVWLDPRTKAPGLRAELLNLKTNT
jgi:hypothetical protein